MKAGVFEMIFDFFTQESTLDLQDTMNLCAGFASLSHNRPFAFVNITMDPKAVEEANSKIKPRKNFHDFINRLAASAKKCSGMSFEAVADIKSRRQESLEFHRDRIDFMGDDTQETGLRIGFTAYGEPTVFLNTTIQELQYKWSSEFNDNQVSFIKDPRNYQDAEESPAFVSANPKQIYVWLTGRTYGAIHSTPINEYGSRYFILLKGRKEVDFEYIKNNGRTINSSFLDYIGYQTGQCLRFFQSILSNYIDC